MRISHAILVVVALVAVGCGADTFQPIPGWEGDITAARAKALDQGKPLAILYTSTWSSKAVKYGRETLAAENVKAELNRFVCVNVNVDDQRSKNSEYGIKWVPALVLVSPLGEVKKLDMGNYPADYVARALQGLKPWKLVDGWADDAAKAESSAKETGKPLATLYSAAWKTAAREYEAEGLRQAQVALAKEFTLLRLNYDAERKRARTDGVKSESQLPALVLNTKDRKIVIPGKHEAALLSGFVKKLGAYQSESDGWSSDAREAGRGKEKSLPVAVVLDEANDWSSHYFLNKTLTEERVSKRLQGFVKIRLKYGPDMAFLKEMKIKVRSAEVPCLLVFDRNGAYYQKRTHKDTANSIVNLLRAVGGRVDTSKAPAKDK